MRLNTGGLGVIGGAPLNCFAVSSFHPSCVPPPHTPLFRGRAGQVRGVRAGGEVKIAELILFKKEDGGLRGREGGEREKFREEQDRARFLLFFV